MGVLIPWINGIGAVVGGATGLCIMAWICFKAQTAIASGELLFIPKPTNTQGCDYSFMAENTLNLLAINQTDPLIPEETIEPDFAIYHISYIWYTLFGCLITISVSVLVSSIVGFNKPSEMDPKLFSPCIRKFLRSNAKREEPLGIEDNINCVDMKALP